MVHGVNFFPSSEIKINNLVHVLFAQRYKRISWWQYRNDQEIYKHDRVRRFAGCYVACSYQTLQDAVLVARGT